MYRKILLLLIACTAIEAKTYHQKRHIESDICNTSYNVSNKIQCSCVKDPRKHDMIRSADCFVNDPMLSETDEQWKIFKDLKSANKVVFTTTKDISIKYVPTNGIKFMTSAMRIYIKYGDIKDIKPYAFANLSEVEEISLSGDQIQQLHRHAFAHHRALATITLDTNYITEINRDVFHDLPSLTKLFITSNKITTIHDRAFINLLHLEELELDRNSIFSLNTETFAGLRNLLRLELSKNALEVIGDNTFKPLVNLKYLNLEGNKIQMLDDKAFNGLSKLRYLSLALNELHELNSPKVFEHLNSLTTLNIKGNKLTELKSEVMAPILNNLYGNTSTLDFEDNDFPCGCHLEWFVSLKNKTANDAMKLTIENLKCIPSASLSELWKKYEENEKAEGKAFENEQQNDDYEYYDESQLGGKLFYIDIRDFLNCTNPNIATAEPVKATEHFTTLKPVTTTKSELTTKVTSSPISSTTIKPIVNTITTAKYTPSKMINRGVLDLSLEETTSATSTAKHEETKDKVSNMEEKKIEHTTSKLVTVSANPIEKRSDNREIVSAKFNAHRAEESTHFKGGAANNVATPFIPVIVLLSLILY